MDNKVSLLGFVVLFFFFCEGRSLLAQKKFGLYLETGDSITADKMNYEIYKRQILAFNVDGERIRLDQVKYMRKATNYYRLEGIKNDYLQIYKREWDGPHIDVYYRSEFEPADFPQRSSVLKKKQFYEKNHAYLKKLTYANLKRDLFNKELSRQTLLTTNKLRTRRNLAIGLGLGILAYEGWRLDQGKGVDALMVLPPILFLFITPLNRKIKKGYQEAIEVYY